MLSVGLLDKIAEAQIREAIERGDLDDLPGAGKPLVLDDDPFVPEELRMAYKVLKNAGYVPEEVRLRKTIGDLQRALAGLEGEDYIRAAKRLNLLRVRLGTGRGDAANLQLEEQYHRKLLERLSAKDVSGRDPRKA